MAAARSYALFLGARNTPRGGRKFSAADDRLVQRITAKHFPAGFTIVEARGGWYDPDARRFRREESREIVVSTARPVLLRPWCLELGRALSQKELLVTAVGRTRRISVPLSA